MTAPLAPGDSYAVPLFGDPIPTPQLLFAFSAVPAPSPAALVPCPSCGGTPCPGCAGTALTLETP
jgi:hypothetical protein